MHLPDNTTRFFAVVGAPYIPEGHFESGCEDARQHPSFAADAERECLQSAEATAWWPRTCH